MRVSFEELIRGGRVFAMFLGICALMACQKLEPTAMPSNNITGVWGEKLENNNTAIPQGKTYEMTFGYVAPSGLTPAVNLNNVQAIAVIFETDNSGKPLRVLNSNRI